MSFSHYLLIRTLQFCIIYLTTQFATETGFIGGFGNGFSDLDS